MSPKVGVAPLRREQIVRATIRCLARDGYAGLTMKKVARTAGVSQGILHYYFADKRAILVAALAAVTADLDRRVATAQARGSREPRTRLRALITACLRLAVEEREFWIVFVEFWGEMMHDRRLREINAALYERMRRQIGALIAQGILHYYFADKRAILVAALETVTADLDRRVAAAQARGGQDAKTRLQALVAACLRLAVEERAFWIVFVEFWGEMMHDRRLREINAALYERMRRLIGAVVVQGVRAGTFRHTDGRRAAAVVLGLVDGVSLQLAFDATAFSVAEATRFCTEAVMRYLAREVS